MMEPVAFRLDSKGALPIPGGGGVSTNTPESPSLHASRTVIKLASISVFRFKFRCLLTYDVIACGIRSGRNIRSNISWWKSFRGPRSGLPPGWLPSVSSALLNGSGSRSGAADRYHDCHASEFFAKLTQILSRGPGKTESARMSSQESLLSQVGGDTSSSHSKSARVNGIENPGLPAETKWMFYSLSPGRCGNDF